MKKKETFVALGLSGKFYIRDLAYAIRVRFKNFSILP